MTQKPPPDLQPMRPAMTLKHLLIYAVGRLQAHGDLAALQYIEANLPPEETRRG